MVEANYNVDLTEIDRASADVERRRKNLAPAFRELRRPMRADQKAHAREQKGPDGAWAPRSPLTEAKRLKRNRATRTSKAMRTISLGRFKRRPTPKRILGKIPGMVICTVGDLFIRVRARLDWPHQQGGRVGRGAMLPGRMYLWPSGSLLDTAKQVIAKFVVKGWQR